MMPIADVELCAAHVAYWPLADMPLGLPDFRFRG